MPPVKSRREMYSDATRAALLQDAAALFAERGYAATSLENVASASRVTRGAVYHHFAGKQALFQAVLAEAESRAIEEIAAAATADDPWEAAMQGLNAFLDKCCDPVYGRLVWQEGPTALGWDHWREFEKSYAQGLVERFVRALIDAGYLADRAVDTAIQFSFWMLGGAGLALAETPEEDKRRVRDEWAELIIRTIRAQRIK